MRQISSWCPEAIENTIEVANKCNHELDWTHIPQFPGLGQSGETSEERLEKEELDLARRYGDDWQTLLSMRLTLKTV